MGDQQWLRKGTLIVSKDNQGLNLSQMRFRFEIVNADVQSPNNCSIRVYNLSDATARQVENEYTEVTLQAGYENGNFGIIFQGTIKQFRRGKESGTDSYLDILAADGDLAYNHAVTKKTLAAGSTKRDELNAHAAALKEQGVDIGYIDPGALEGGFRPRGKVLFGMTRAHLEKLFPKQWSIQQGRLQVMTLDGYLPGEAVLLNSATGLIGMPEQTQDGIKVRCLLNPKIVIGGLIKIDQRLMNEMSANGKGGWFLSYNQYGGQYEAPSVASDGLYRVYVAEHKGDTRDQEWYTDLVCLAVDASTSKVIAKN